MSNQQATYSAGRGFNRPNTALGQMTLNDVVASQNRLHGFDDWWRQSGSSGDILRGVAASNPNWMQYTPRPIREGHQPLRGFSPIDRARSLRNTYKYGPGGTEDNPKQSLVGKAVNIGRAMRMKSPSGDESDESTRESLGPEVGRGGNQPRGGGGWPGGGVATSDRSHLLFNVSERPGVSGEIGERRGALPPGSQFADFGNNGSLGEGTPGIGAAEEWSPVGAGTRPMGELPPAGGSSYTYTTNRKGQMGWDL